jgi:RNA polymerase sigma-70 factor (ECF subfamily)
MAHPGNDPLVLIAAAERFDEGSSPRVGLDASQLFVTHGPFIGRVIRRLTGDGPQVDDLLQETFIVAHRRRADFDPRSDARAWLYGIAAKLCSRHHRGLSRFARLKQRLVEELPEGWASPVERPDRALERQEEVRTVREAIERLSFKQREVFVLFELEGLEGEAIAELLGLPLGTVWTRLKAARERFTQQVRRARLKETR